MSEKDQKTTFITWEGFLVAGMCSQNEPAKRIKIYLLKMERIARTALYINTDDFRRAGTLAKLIKTATQIDDKDYKKILRKEIERISGETLPEPAQGDLPGV